MAIRLNISPEEFKAANKDVVFHNDTINGGVYCKVKWEHFEFGVSGLTKEEWIIISFNEEKFFTVAPSVKFEEPNPKNGYKLHIKDWGIEQIIAVLESNSTIFPEFTVYDVIQRIDTLLFFFDRPGLETITIPKEDEAWFFTCLTFNFQILYELSVSNFNPDIPLDLKVYPDLNSAFRGIEGHRKVILKEKSTEQYKEIQELRKQAAVLRD